MPIETESLIRLFRPKSVAVCGASGDVTKLGGRVLRYLDMMGFEGDVYPINPTRDEVQGYKAFPSVQAVAGEIDLAVIVVPADAAVAAVEDCARKGVKAALVISSGFAEVGPGGLAAQERIVELAGQAGMRILGPNCLGFVNNGHKLSATFSPSRELCWPAAGPIGFASQSGAFASYCAGTMRDRGMGLATWITTGNEADVDLADAISFLAADDSVKVIAAYMEGCRDTAKLSEAFEMARRSQKPIVMLKVGITEVGAAAVASHTASMAGRDDLFDAYFRSHGVVRVKSIEELLDTLYVCAYGPKPSGKRTAIISNSGGVGVLMGDEAVSSGLTLDPLPEDIQASIREFLPYAGTLNPVDTTAQIMSNMRNFDRCFDLVIDGAKADIVFTHLSLMGYDDAAMGMITDPLFELRRAHPEKQFFISMLCPEERLKSFEAAGFLVFADPTRAIRAAARSCTVYDRLGQEPQAAVDYQLSPVEGLETEAAAKEFLSTHGIPVPREALATSAAQAGEFAAEFGGKVVMKIMSPDIQHKTEVGGVVLDVEGGEAAASIYHEIIGRVKAARPEADVHGILVCQQVGPGYETIAGVVNDPALGPFVMFGLGGIYAEVLKDVVFRPAPFDQKVARSMIDELKTASILKGARGQAEADLEALSLALSNLSQVAAAGQNWIESIDINPLIVRPDGVFAVDALVVSRP